MIFDYLGKMKKFRETINHGEENSDQNNEVIKLRAARTKNKDRKKGNREKKLTSGML